MSVGSGPGAEAGPAELLRRDVASDRVAHAYLFTGAGGAEPVRVALWFAASVLCAEGGCGTCDTCLRILRMAHPDVEMIEPAGTQLLVEQVRDVVRAAWRRPVAGPRRVIVVEGADRMNPNAQNAFLKALEEPPASTTIVLIAPSAESLLETVRSRCREVVFRAPSIAEVAGTLVSNGVADEDARRWAVVGGGSERAEELATDPDARARRERAVAWTLEPMRDPGEALDRAALLAADAKAIRERVSEQHKEHLAEYADWYREAKKAADDRLRREQRRAEQAALEAALDDISSVLRDLLAASADPQAPLLNTDRREAIADRARTLGPGCGAGIVACLGEVERCRRRLRANANVLLTLERAFVALQQHL